MASPLEIDEQFRKCHEIEDDHKLILRAMKIKKIPVRVWELNGKLFMILFLLKKFLSSLSSFRDLISCKLLLLF